MDSPQDSEATALDVGANNLVYAGMAIRTRYPERSLTGGIKAGFACAGRIDVNQ